MPLTTKKMGMRNPNPMASSLALMAPALRTGREEANDDAGGEGPEQHVEAEHLGQQHQQHDEQQRHAHRQLGARLQMSVEQRHHARRLSPGRQEDGDHRHGDERSSSSEVSTGSLLVSSRATATIGPNSPTVPMAEM